MRKLLTILFFLPFLAGAQSPARDFDTTFLTNLGTRFNARVHVPAGYYSQPTWQWDGIIFFVGLGEIGTDTSLIAINGPNDYLKVWDGGVQINASQIHYPVIVTLQEPSFYHPQQMERVVDSVITNLHMFPGNVHLCGISLGSQVANQFVMYQNVNGVPLYGAKIRSVVNVIGETPDQYGTGLPYAACFSGWANIGGREAAFEQALDNRDIKKIVDTLNSHLNKSFYFQTNYGGGGHCCWQQEYGDHTGTVPLTYNFGGRVQNIYQWMVTQGTDTTATYHGVVNTPPTCSTAGPQTITLPTSTIIISGSAAGTNGASIVSTVWSIYSNPAGAASITSPNSLNTGVTGLTGWGNYIFKLLVTDNHGLTAVSYESVNVIPACNVSTFRKYTIPTNGAGQIYYPNGLAGIGIIPKGGDTLVIPSNIYYSQGIQFGEISGDPCNPIIIMGDGVADVISYKFNLLKHCQYIHVTGIGVPGHFYGIHLGNPTVSTFFATQSNHLEIDHIYIDSASGSTSFFIKTTCDTTNMETIFPNYTMNVVHLHHCYIQKTGNEGTYIGNTNTYGTDPGQPFGVANRMDSVEMDHLIVRNTGYNGLKLTSARDGCSIHDCNIYNAGVAGNTGFSAGITAGGASNIQLYNDTIIRVLGDAIESFGYGVENWHDIIIDSAALGGGATIFFADLTKLTFLTETSAALQVNLYNSFIKHPPVAPAVFSVNQNGTLLSPNIHDNQWCIPGANPGTWQTTYFNLVPAGTLTNNVLVNCSAIITVIKMAFSRKHMLKFHP